jgi:ribokinase
VVVFGSINMDLIVGVPRWLRPGETLTGSRFFTAPGGKGANQAVAAARLGAPTRLIGRVGADVFGPDLRAGLAAAGVDIAGIATDPGAPSGVALITVDPSGENQIVVVPGANGTFGADDLARLDAALTGARVLLLQLEIPLEAVCAAAAMARRRGITVILDPAPARELPAELYALVDILTPNESEAAILAGFPLTGEAAMVTAAQALRERGAATVILTRGGQGLYWTDGAASGFRPALAMAAVDTTGAGDAFNGALAAALAEGLPFPVALDWASVAGALAVTRPGAQPAMPDRAAVLRHLPPYQRG